MQVHQEIIIVNIKHLYLYLLVRYTALTHPTGKAVSTQSGESATTYTSAYMYPC